MRGWCRIFWKEVFQPPRMGKTVNRQDPQMLKTRILRTTMPHHGWSSKPSCDHRHTRTRLHSGVKPRARWLNLTESWPPTSAPQCLWVSSGLQHRMSNQKGNSERRRSWRQKAKTARPPPASRPWPRGAGHPRLHSGLRLGFLSLPSTAICPAFFFLRHATAQHCKRADSVGSPPRWTGGRTWGGGPTSHSCAAGISREACRRGNQASQRDRRQRETSQTGARPEWSQGHLTGWTETAIFRSWGYHWPPDKLRGPISGVVGGQGAVSKLQFCFKSSSKTCRLSCPPCGA